jgi:hypothetical protein
MKKPLNFEKINNIEFISESTIGYHMSETVDGVWILPTNEYVNLFNHVVLININWEKNHALVSFPAIGQGTMNKKKVEYQEPIQRCHVESMASFINWCRNRLREYEKEITK